MTVEDSDAPDERGSSTPSGPPPARAQDHHAVRRTLVAGGLTVALVCGFMTLSAASLPWNALPQQPDFTEPLPEQADAEPGPVVAAASSGGPSTIAQVLDAVARAEATAAEAGREIGPDVQRSAAELGGLLVTYVAQQDALVDPRVGAPSVRSDVVLEVPTTEVPTTEVPTTEVPTTEVPATVAPDADPGSTQLSPPALAPTPSPTPDGTDPGTARTPAEQGTAVVPEPGLLDVPSLTVPGSQDLDATFSAASTVSRVIEPDDVTGGAAAGPGTVAGAPTDAGTAVPPATAGEHPDDESHEHGDEAVTFDDVVIAATNLTTLLDPATASYVLDVMPSVTQLPDGTLVNDEGIAVDVNGIPLGATAPGLVDALQAVVDQYAGSTAGYANGRIPATVLCTISWASWHMLRCDAAAQLEALNAEYRAEFGTDIPITDSYRSYEAQVAVRAAKPTLAAVPGTSNHGWGLALDLSTPISGGRSAEYAWLRVHGPDYGWDNPTWARLDGRKPEPWHWEFFAAGPIPDRAPGDFGAGWAAGGTTADDGTASGKDKGGKAKDAKDKGTKDGKDKSGGKADDKDKATKPDPAPTPKPSPTPKPKPSPSPSPSTSPKPSPSPSTSPKPSPSPSTSPKPSPSPSPSPSTPPSPSPSPSTSPSPAPVPSGTPTPESTEPGPESEPPATGDGSESTDESTAATTSSDDDTAAAAGE